MGEMKVEHVLLFLVGAFLVYHMMGKCGCKEGISRKEVEEDLNKAIYIISPQVWAAPYFIDDVNDFMTL